MKVVILGYAEFYDCYSKDDLKAKSRLLSLRIETPKGVKALYKDGVSLTFAHHLELPVKYLRDIK